MKQKFIIAAGLLCLGTSPVFASTIPAMAPDMAKAVKDVWADQMAGQQEAVEQPTILETGDARTGEAKTPDAKSAALQTLDEAPAKPADATTTMAASGDPDLDLAVKPDEDSAKAGPSEAVLETNSTPAAAAYPPCSRGAGDDHCIQLYERGVRAQLAEWNQSSSGSDAAMGGPYEPVDTTLAGELGGSDSTSTKGDGVTDTAIGETPDAADGPK